jgi:hypothetical protein
VCNGAGQHLCVRSLILTTTLQPQAHSVLCRTTGHTNERKQAPNIHLQVLAFAKRNFGTALKTMLGGEPHVADNSVFYSTVQQALDKLNQPTQHASVFRGRACSEGLGDHKQQ